MSQQTPEHRFPIYFGYGDDIAQKPHCGVANIADVMAFLCDTIVNADIMDNITSQGRDGLYMIMQASQRQLETLSHVIEEQADADQICEDTQAAMTTAYPKIKRPLIHKNQIEGLSQPELLMLINEARGHSPKAAAMAVGVDNADISQINIRLEKRGLIESQDYANQDTVKQNTAKSA